jgi:hypothetical protein
MSPGALTGGAGVLLPDRFPHRTGETPAVYPGRSNRGLLLISIPTNRTRPNNPPMVSAAESALPALV